MPKSLAVAAFALQKECDVHTLKLDSLQNTPIFLLAD
jgi:hypothetical protein